MKMRQCRKCAEELPLTREFFYRDKTRADGFRSICKVCYSELPSVRKQNKELGNGG